MLCTAREGVRGRPGRPATERSVSSWHARTVRCPTDTVKHTESHCVAGRFSSLSRQDKDYIIRWVLVQVQRSIDDGDLFPPWEDEGIYADTTVWPFLIEVRALEGSAEEEQQLAGLHRERHFRDVALRKAQHHDDISAATLLTIRANDKDGCAEESCVIHLETTDWFQDTPSTQALVGRIAARVRETAHRDGDSVWKKSLVKDCVNEEVS